MFFKQKRFRKIPSAILSIQNEFYIGIDSSKLSEKDLIKIGLTQDFLPLVEGIDFLPSKIGKFSTINADGLVVVRKDLPKEKFYQESAYTWKEWHGKEQVEFSGTRSQERFRYQRERLAAPNIKVTTIKIENSIWLLFKCAPNEENLLHKLNLALELFGEFSLALDAKDGPIVLPAKVKFVEWLILKSGTLTDQEIKEKIEQTISKKMKKTLRPVILQRLEHIRCKGPEEIAIGSAGYQGYVVYNFFKLGISILESEYPDNATYVFDSSKWEDLSKLSKTEILKENLAKDRIFHNKDWSINIDQLFENTKRNL